MISIVFCVRFHHCKPDRVKQSGKKYCGLDCFVPRNDVVLLRPDCKSNRTGDAPIPPLKGVRGMYQFLEIPNL